jgi:5-methylcytosine-specific restriction endonuclease McrA
MVWKRDRGRCTFVGESGHCCGSRRFVQFDHRVPRARGGPSTVENVRLLCAPHNRLEAERIFGAGFMREKRERSRSSRALRTRGNGNSESYTSVSTASS